MALLLLFRGVVSSSLRCSLRGVTGLTYPDDDKEYPVDPLVLEPYCPEEAYGLVALDVNVAVEEPE